MCFRVGVGRVWIMSFVGIYRRWPGVLSICVSSGIYVVWNM